MDLKHATPTQLDDYFSRESEAESKERLRQEQAVYKDAVRKDVQRKKMIGRIEKEEMEELQWEREQHRSYDVDRVAMEVEQHGSGSGKTKRRRKNKKNKAGVKRLLLEVDFSKEGLKVVQPEVVSADEVLWGWSQEELDNVNEGARVGLYMDAITFGENKLPRPNLKKAMHRAKAFLRAYTDGEDWTTHLDMETVDKDLEGFLIAHSVLFWTELRGRRLILPGFQCYAGEEKFVDDVVVNVPALDANDAKRKGEEITIIAKLVPIPEKDITKEEAKQRAKLEEKSPYHPHIIRRAPSPDHDNELDKVAMVWESFGKSKCGQRRMKKLIKNGAAEFAKMSKTALEDMKIKYFNEAGEPIAAPAKNWRPIRANARRSRNAYRQKTKRPAASTAPANNGEDPLKIPDIVEAVQMKVQQLEEEETIKEHESEEDSSEEDSSESEDEKEGEETPIDLVLLTRVSERIQARANTQQAKQASMELHFVLNMSYKTGRDWREYVKDKQLIRSVERQFYLEQKLRKNKGQQKEIKPVKEAPVEQPVPLDIEEITEDGRCVPIEDVPRRPAQKPTRRRRKRGNLGPIPPNKMEELTRFAMEKMSMG